MKVVRGSRRVSRAWGTARYLTPGYNKEVETELREVSSKRRQHRLAHCLPCACQDLCGTQLQHPLGILATKTCALSRPFERYQTTENIPARHVPGRSIAPSCFQSCVSGGVPIYNIFVLLSCAPIASSWEHAFPRVRFGDLEI